MTNFKRAYSSLKTFLNKQSVKTGLPFFIFIAIAPFGLKQFTSLRYEYSKKNLISFEEAEKLGIEMKKPGEVTLEKEYEKLKKMDIDNWEPVRIPRPWDENEK